MQSPAYIPPVRERKWNRSKRLTKTTYLFNHVHLLREYANTVRSLPQVEKAVLTAGHYVANLRKDSIKQLDYRILYSDILGRTYVLSQRLEDFSKAIDHIQQYGYS